MKNTKSLSFTFRLFCALSRAICPSLLIATSLLLVGVRAKSQTLNVSVWAQFSLSQTNVLNSTNSLWVDGQLTQAVGVADDPSTCGPTIATSPVTITVELNKAYTVDYQAIFCDVGSDSAIFFDGIPPCSHLLFGSLTNT